MALAISMKADLSGVQRALFNLHASQVPFASALALTRLAKGVVGEEAKAIDQTFDTPTRFTENAFFAKPATKSNLVAWVSTKDIQAEYLEPYIDGGDRWLGSKKGMLAPRNISLNQYGNLPRNKLKALQGRKDVFFGPVKFKSGQTISGVWQRSASNTPRGRRRKGGGEYGTKGNNRNVIGGTRTTLKLLIRFEDSTPTKKHLPFAERARAYVKANARTVFSDALRTAMATQHAR